MSTHVTDCCIVLFCIQFRIQQTGSLSHLQNVHRKSASLNGKHQMETFSALLALCEWKSTSYRWIPFTKASGTKLCFFYLRLNKWLSKQSRRQWVDTQWPVTQSYDIFFDLRLTRRDDSDLRRHRAHYNVIAMSPLRLWDMGMREYLVDIQIYVTGENKMNNQKYVWKLRHYQLFVVVTYLLLLISMLWHRQAIFESKGNKLSSSAGYRIRTLRHQIASRMNAR